MQESTFLYLNINKGVLSASTKHQSQEVESSGLGNCSRVYFKINYMENKTINCFSVVTQVFGWQNYNNTIIILFIRLILLSYPLKMLSFKNRCIENY